MGDDYDRAEGEYWHAKGLGYTDEEIISMDEWPTRPKDRYTLFKHGETPAVRRWLNQPSPYDPAGPGPAPGYFPGPDDGYDTGALDRPGRLFREALHEAKSALNDSIKREATMPINTCRTAAELRALIDEATRTLALLEKTPNEPAEKLTTIGATFPTGDNIYTYVALRINGKWRVSGRHFNGLRLTWPEIFARFDEIHATVKYVSTPVEFRSEKVN